jgi:hypothetical protein
VYHFSEKTRRPYYDLDWAFHATPFKLARIHSIKCQQLVQPQVEDQSQQNKRWQGSDYGYLPRWGLFTPESIQGLYNNHKTTFKMRDSTSILLCPLDGLYSIAQKGDIKWITDNPGHQMLTGSFHPVEDSAWEDKENWAQGYLPKQLFTVGDIFDTKRAVRLKQLREKVCPLLVF